MELKDFRLRAIDGHRELYLYRTHMSAIMSVVLMDNVEFLMCAMFQVTQVQARSKIFRKLWAAIRGHWLVFEITNQHSMYDSIARKDAFALPVSPLMALKGT